METYTLKFGEDSINAPELGIYKGKVTLSNEELKPVFDKVIDKILKGCVDTLIRQQAKVM